MSVAIKIENLSKQYRLGLVSTRTLSHDLNRWWQTSILGREDPYLKIGEENKISARRAPHASGRTPDDYVWALKDINLEIEEGEVLGIIGKNGAGKSTLLKILSKVTAPTTGTIKARGRIASLLEVGTGFHYEMTGRENIFLNGAILGMTKAEISRKLDEIIDFAGVERYIDTPVKRYSSGMLVRLGFAVAAHLEPEILIVDEVLAVGDAEFQTKAIGKMREVSRNDGRIVFFVSHNLMSISALCGNTVLMEQGKILLFEKTDQVIYEYLKHSKVKADGVVKVVETYFRFLGIRNIKSLLNLTPFDNITFELCFQSDIDLKNVYIDLGLYNHKEQMVLHTKAKFISSGIQFNKYEKCIINYSIKSPHLAPGEYFLTIYVYIPDKILYWCENLKALNINSLNAYRNNRTIILDDIKGIIVPTFSIVKNEY